MIIRPYEERDFSAAKGIVDEVNEQDFWKSVHPSGWDIERTKAEFDSVFTYQHPVFSVASINTETIGLIAGHDLDSFVASEIPHLASSFQALRLLRQNTFYQRDILIKPDHQNQGIGIALFSHLQEHARGKDFSHLVTRTPPDNVQGVSFFENLGYAKIFDDDNPRRAYFAQSL